MGYKFLGEKEGENGVYDILKVGLPHFSDVVGELKTERKPALKRTNIDSFSCRNG